MNKPLKSSLCISQSPNRTSYEWGFWESIFYELSLLVGMAFLFSVFVCPIPGMAQETVTPIPISPPKLKATSPTDTEDPIIQLTYQVGMIGIPNSGPTLEVYNDRKVRVCRPLHMKDAGCRELTLSQEDFDDLLETFADEDILRTDTQSLKAVTAEALKDIGEIQKPNTHGSTKTLAINHMDYIPAGETSPSLRDIQKSITAEDLSFHAKTLKNVSEVQALARGIQKLEALAKREDLKKVP